MLLLFWGSVALDWTGAGIPLLRQIAGFFLLTIVPGLCLFHVMGINDVGGVRALVYTVGLSLILWMIIGFAMNMVLPVFGVSTPLSGVSLYFWVSVVLIILLALLVVVGRRREEIPSVGTSFTIGPSHLFFILLPLLTGLGVYAKEVWGTNLVLMGIVLVIACIPLLIGSGKVFDEELYPLAIFSIGLSLLLHTVLISGHVWGWDINEELYFGNLVAQNGVWNHTLYSNVNAMLSVVILLPLYSGICAITPVWVFKLIYPLLFSLVPLGLYVVYRQQTSPLNAFFGTFFFVSFYVFFTEMLQLARQQVAELFLVLIVLVFLDQALDRPRRVFLMALFAFGLVSSHYGLTYLFLAALVPSVLVLLIAERDIIRRVVRRLMGWWPHFSPVLTGKTLRLISVSFVLQYCAFILIWYLFASEAAAFTSAAEIVESVLSSLHEELFSSDASQGLHIILSPTETPLHELYKILQFVSQGLIVLGIISVPLFAVLKSRFSKDYFALSIMFLGLCVAGIVVPYFSSALNTSRLYQISLIFIAPFLVYGFMVIAGLLAMPFRKILPGVATSWGHALIALFLAVFFLFNTGFVFEVANDGPTSLALSELGEYPVFSEPEVVGASWLVSAAGDAERKDRYMYGDDISWLVVRGFAATNSWMMSAEGGHVPEGSYLFFGSENLRNESVKVTAHRKVVRVPIHLPLQSMVVGRGKIYDGGTAAVFR
ncbi:DUF2206 domain-containing protein [Methanofollis formosanus]|uniref:DUF2206 domain-containing protein n=1 Tax=Methanofollis formosanus TaxID=299308 RepID=A0A8G1EGL8_9EURY|nr:DUF2206 domain-containing protein [Methanofollis formosanus]QYZ79304.1 DUF2206 domain-containing protein [Methanofollis formosanus]